MNTAIRHRILLVDDHPMMRHGMRQMLELEDDLHVVGEAGNGQEALDQIATLQPDLVLLDNNMPHMNGLETLRRLRAMNYAGRCCCLPCPTRRTIFVMRYDWMPMVICSRTWNRSWWWSSSVMPCREPW